MKRVLMILAVISIAGRGPTEGTESGAITSVAEDAKQARTAAQDAVTAAEAAARRDEAASQIQPDAD